jgi:GNAT superfamily N-acetyltransferase
VDWPLIDAFHRRCSPTSLRRRWGRTHIPARHIQRLLEHNTVWLTLDHGAVIAMASAGPVSGQTGVVDLGLQVADDHQRQGIGTALAHHVAAHARAAGAHTLSLYTEASNTLILHLARRLGTVHINRTGTCMELRLPLARASPDRRSGSGPR